MAGRKSPHQRAQDYYEDLSSGRIEEVGDALVMAYQWAANALVDRVHSGEEPWPIVAVPVLFLYRHHLELALKNCAPYVRLYIEQGRSLFGLDSPDFTWVNPGTHSHKLLSSWKSLRSMQEASNLDLDTDLTEQAERVIEWFAVLDSSSFTFRYPEEFLEAGIDVDDIDPLQLKEDVSVASIAISGLRDWLDHLITLGNEIGDAYRP